MGHLTYCAVPPVRHYVIRRSSRLPYNLYTRTYSVVPWILEKIYCSSSRFCCGERIAGPTGSDNEHRSCHLNVLSLFPNQEVGMVREDDIDLVVAGSKVEVTNQSSVWDASTPRPISELHHFVTNMAGSRTYSLSDGSGFLMASRIRYGISIHTQIMSYLGWLILSNSMFFTDPHRVIDIQQFVLW